MRVTQVEDSITHAVIGGTQAIDFGISENPEFFHILSSTLYKNQKLAVVRETLCNAWDAHIEANKTDEPISIILTAEELIIEDFGLGIPHSLIGQVYGTYGNSTKKNDGRATGGFGLGCKSPFAYTDHFEVVSCNGGTGTIYNLSKSNAEVGGKPGIIPITNYPTDTVGLKVTIPLKDTQDHHAFHELIVQIVSQGGMKAKYKYLERDTYEIEALPFDKMQSNYLVSNQRIHDDTNIMVRYGNVLYPVSVNEAYVAAYDEISTFLAALAGNHRSGYRRHNRNNSNWTIIFQAEPNSLTITPSREELSMQEFTIKTLTGLLNDFLEVLRTKVENRVMPTIEEAVRDRIAAYDFKELFDRTGRLPTMSAEKNNGNAKYYGSVTGLIHAFVRHNYPNGYDHYYKELNARINGLIRAGYCGQAQLKAFKKMLKYKMEAKNYDPMGVGYLSSSQFAKIFIQPLLSALDRKKLPTNRLCIYAQKKDRRGYSYELTPQPLSELKSYEMNKAFQFLSNTVILSYTKSDIQEYLHETQYSSFFGDKETALVYLVSKNEKERETARQLFYDRGYVVFDLTYKYEQEQLRIHALKEARKRIQESKVVNMEVVPEVIPGIRTMSSYLNQDQTYFEPHSVEDEENIDRIEHPKCVIRLYNRRTNFSNCISRDLGNNTLGRIAKMFGKRIGVCETTPKYESMLSKSSAVTLGMFLQEQFEEAFSSDANFAARISIERANYSDKLTSNQRNILRFIKNDPILAQKFGIEAPLTTEQSEMYLLWKELEGHYCLNKEFAALQRYVDRVPPNECMKHLIQTVMKTNLWELINTSYLPNLSQQLNKSSYLYPSEHPSVQLARKMILLVLKG